MCGRTGLAIDVTTLTDRFDVTPTDAVDAYLPRYNIAPGDGLVTITNDTPDTADLATWGFTPEWVDEPDDAPTPINARAETVATNNMFDTAFEHRRCLIIADGFYEWTSTRGHKQPYRIHRDDNAPFAFAGIYSHHDTVDGDTQPTTAILTTDANYVVAPIHDRMPVILPRNHEHTWLTGTPGDAANLLESYPADELTAHPVSTAVNDPGNNSPSLYDPVDIAEQTGLDDYGA